jgi:hypothetical protein
MEHVKETHYFTTSTGFTYRPKLNKQELKASQPQGPPRTGKNSHQIYKKLFCGTGKITNG